ncbi:ABC transporter permease [Demequina sp. SO4-18]|uniref:ABC transporter permease n=1 Tax=Demequina sp. SO4-18 TaxID=3401026 RepID=UPI003B58FFFE
MSQLLTAQSLSRLRGANNEGVLALVLVALVIAMSAINPDFFSLPILFAILRSAIVPLVLALGVLIVIISGGIDVSFPAIATFAAYGVVHLSLTSGMDPGLAVMLVGALVIGAGLGAINGFLIATFRLPTLIVTLGTQGIFRGALLTFVGTRFIADLPESFASLSTANIIDTETASGQAYLHVLVVPALALCVAVAWMLRSTMFGRSIYAIGGDSEAARRAGVKVVRTQVWMYTLVGMLAAIGGLMYVAMGRSASPQDLVGTELDIIAAVVLGGASIFGGRGSVLGTFLGVLLIQVINNSLILVGVPSAWQRAVVGVLLVIGVAIQVSSARSRKRKPAAIVQEEEVTHA